MKKQTPFYEFDEKGFVLNYNNLVKAMTDVYPNYLLSYSYKTNYTPYVCKLVKELGGYAEVVSDLEYLLAKKIGYDNSKIIYNGPCKGRCLEEHIENNGIVNIDNLEEAKRIVGFSLKNNSKQYKVGIRLNIRINDGFVSRFGLEGDELTETVNLLKNAKLKIVGLHCHISRNRDLDSWKKRAEFMIKMADELIDGVPEYISLGSGMYGDMPAFLKDQFANVPTYEEYAKASMRPFFEHYKGKMPIVFTEPGTTLIARYFSFFTSVVSIKQVHNRNVANVDGCYQQLGEIASLKKIPIQVIDSKGKYYESIDVMGFTCLEQDLLYEGYSGRLSVGDVMRFDNVGGYSIVLKPQFIQQNCPVYCGEKVIMREESFEDVFDKFVF